MKQLLYNTMFGLFLLYSPPTINYVHLHHVSHRKISYWKIIFDKILSTFSTISIFLFFWTKYLHILHNIDIIREAWCPEMYILYITKILKGGLCNATESK